MNILTAKKRMNEVLMVDSIDSTRSDFLATHVPFRKIEVQTNFKGHFEQTNRSEVDIYKEVFENESAKNEHQFIIVEGSSGAGKSHFIRWLYAMLISRENKDDAVLLIRRSDNTLKGTIRQLLEIDEIKQIENREAYDRLVKAEQAISEQEFKFKIYYAFIEEIETDTEGRLSKLKRKRLIALMNNASFQQKLMSSGGPIERIYSKIVNSSSSVDLDLTAQFKNEDLSLDIDFIEKLTDNGADRNAVKMAEGLDAAHDDNEISETVGYLNSFVETVIQASAGIEPGDFQQIFKEIRQELKRNEKNLILLIEDITSFTGINQALLNALVTGHTGENAADNICRLISVVGTTSQYYNQFRDNYRDRITKQITIQDGAIGDNKNDLIQFTARYLNALSLESAVLDEWAKNGAYSEDMPVHVDSEHKDWGYFALSSRQKLSLFPFTEEAIVNLYNAMPSHKTPRYILRSIVEPALNEVIYRKSLFPQFCQGWRSNISETVESRIYNIISSLGISDDVKSDYRKRLTAFIGFWTNKTLDVTDDGCIAGKKTEIFKEAGFEDFVLKLTKTAVLKSKDKPVNNGNSLNNTGNTSYTKSINPIVKPEDKSLEKQNKGQTEYDEFRKNVNIWHYDGEKLLKFQKVRDAITNFVYDTINWQQEGVPVDSKKLFKDAIGRNFIGFERQDQALDKCVIAFDDNEETFRLLLCFGKWCYLGNNSWNFEDAASSIYFATSWLEKNKSKFIEAVRGYEKSAAPAYVKAAMTAQLYKLILNGKMAGKKLSRIDAETFLTQDSKKNDSKEFKSGHSESWYSLLDMIYEDGQSKNSYTSSVRYFNLIQGDAVNTNSYFLNYVLFKNTIREIKKSNFVIEEDEQTELEKRVKGKKEIFEYYKKVSSKIVKTICDEKELARKTAEEILAKYEFDFEDEVEASDIRNMLNDIKEFYNKAFSVVNLGKLPENDIKTLLKRVGEIENAMKILQSDYSQISDINALMEFTSNPIGTSLDFLQLLEKAEKDADKTLEKMKIEEELLKRKGTWKTSTDPRFEEKRGEFEKLYSAFKEV